MISPNVSKYSILSVIVLKIGVLIYYQSLIVGSLEVLITQHFLVIDKLHSMSIETTSKSIQDVETTKRYTLDDSPYRKHFSEIEKSTKTQLKNVIEHIMRDEGVRYEPYADNIGIAIGAGRNLTTYGISTLELRLINPSFDINDFIDKISIGDKGIFIEDIPTAKSMLDTPLTDHQVSLLLFSNLYNISQEAKHIFGETWNTLDPARKEAIADMLYNLGVTKFKEFKKFIDAIFAKDYIRASQEVLLSLAAKQNSARYHRISKVIETGDVSYFHTP